MSSHHESVMIRIPRVLSQVTLGAASIPFLLALPARGDGNGIIGFGKWMYRPACAHACRSAIAGCTLMCEPEIMSGLASPTDIHNTTPHGFAKRHGHSGMTPPDCFVTDAAFTRTLALCIDKYCTAEFSDGQVVPVSVIEDYWATHLATGSVAAPEPHPNLSWGQALALAKADIKQYNSEKDIPEAIGDEELMVTSKVTYETWLPFYNGNVGFEQNENYHGLASMVLVITAFGVPILLSFARFLPIPSSWASWFNSMLILPPLLGRRHRTPLPAQIGLMPTRGQAMFIAYLCLINTIFMVTPYHLLQPNYIFADKSETLVATIAARTGVLSFVDLAVLSLFSGRNNILLYITNWSHSTFLLLHRWVGYLAILQAVIHSILELVYYINVGGYAANTTEPFWIWGIVATIAMVVIWPLGMLHIRIRFYELFLVSHIILIILTVVGCYYHMWYRFEHDWGYEIWIYLTGGLWGADRLWRIARTARNGICSALITRVDDAGEYLRIDIDGVSASGHVYLYFPTISGRVWENHPFSVLSSFTGSIIGNQTAGTPADDDDVEKSNDAKSPTIPYRRVTRDSVTVGGDVRQCTTVIIRVRKGLTSALASRVLSSTTLRLPVLVESSYHAVSDAKSSLATCSTLLGIAGGVGISGVLPTLQTYGGLRAHLHWGIRAESGHALVTSLQEEVLRLPSHVQVHATIGLRLNLREIISQELAHNDIKGKLGVIVCGPAEMADEVRQLLCEFSGSKGRGFVLVDEAFAW